MPKSNKILQRYNTLEEKRKKKKKALEDFLHYNIYVLKKYVFTRIKFNL
jgi:hypothetical protein